MSTTSNPIIDKGNYYDLKTRGLTKQTCEKFGITCTKYTGSFGHGNNLHYVKNHWIFVFNQTFNGKLVKQKIRSTTVKKDMKMLGDTSLKELYGQSIFQPRPDKIIVITEGEFDAAVVWQETQFYAVSLTGGAGSAVSDIKNNIDYLSKFQYVILGFDNDQAGNDAVQKVLDENIFEPGKVRIAHWPLKDANELSLADRSLDIKKALWDAEEYRPKDLYTAIDLVDAALIKPTIGVNTPWPSLTESIAGWRANTIITIAAADGIGKTEIVDEILHCFMTAKLKVWLYSCEQDPEETLRRQAGKSLNLPLHIPGVEWDTEGMRKSMLALGDKLVLWRPDKASGVEDFLGRMRYVAIASGIKYFIIDHLKGVESQMTDLNNSMGKFFAELKFFVKQHNACIILLSHVAKDKKQGRVGKDDESWNRGRVPTKENIYGSSAISAWSDIILALSRNVEADNPDEACVTKVSILKNRLMGNRGQKAIYTKYIEDTGRIIEIEPIDYDEEDSGN